ncbi:uncharacterized protein [Arachis hypogaea]|uniref:uncharacterized protein n=1 Tax=Arachis hypogaea TaxID=3818 RepID=UPI003B20C910
MATVPVPADIRPAPTRSGRFGETSVLTITLSVRVRNPFLSSHFLYSSALLQDHSESSHHSQFLFTSRLHPQKEQSSSCFSQKNPSLLHRRCHPSRPKASSVRRAPAPLLVPLFLVRSSRCSVALCLPSLVVLVAGVRRARPSKVFSNYLMASNAREDTQSNSVAPNDDEIEVQSNVNPTSETPQATDNVSTPEGSTPNEGDNKTHVKSAYCGHLWEVKV